MPSILPLGGLLLVLGDIPGSVGVISAGAGAVTEDGAETGLTTTVGVSSSGAGDGAVINLLSTGVIASGLTGKAAGSLDVSTVARFLNIRI